MNTVGMTIVTAMVAMAIANIWCVRKLWKLDAMLARIWLLDQMAFMTLARSLGDKADVDAVKKVMSEKLQ